MSARPIEARGARMRIAETAVILRVADDHGQLLAGILEAQMRLAHQRAADAGAVECRLNGERRQRHGRELALVLFDEKARKEDMTDDGAFLFGNEFQQRIAFIDERVDETGLDLLSERMLLDQPDRLAIFRRGCPDCHHTHKTVIPFSSFTPRRNSSALATRPPAR